MITFLINSFVFFSFLSLTLFFGVCYLDFLLVFSCLWEEKPEISCFWLVISVIWVK